MVNKVEIGFRHKWGISVGVTLLSLAIIITTDLTIESSYDLNQIMLDTVSLIWVDFWRRFTSSGGGNTLTFLIIASLSNKLNRWFAVYLLTALFLIITVNNLTKMGFAEERPAWSSHEFAKQGLSCNMEFGYPSGHAMTAATLAGVLYAFYTRGKEFKSHVALYIIGGLVAFIYAIAMSFSRVILAKHSLK